MINKKLNWSDHITTKVAKSNSILGLLKRLMYGCSEMAKKKAFVSLVRPRMEYCAAVWNPHLRKGIDAVEKIQRRRSRWICCRWSKQYHSWSRSYDDACTHLGWKPLGTRRTVLSCCQVYKINNNLDCIHFDSYYSFNQLGPIAYLYFVPLQLSMLLDILSLLTAHLFGIHYPLTLSLLLHCIPLSIICTSVSRN